MTDGKQWMKFVFWELEEETTRSALRVTGYTAAATPATNNS